MLIMATFKFNRFMKFLIIFVMFLIISSPIQYAGDNEEAHAYTIPVIIKFINISDDGISTQSHEINYTLDESNNQVYYTIGLSPNEKVNNISIRTPNYYNTYEIISNSNEVKIRVSLFKDDAKTQKINNRSVKVIYDYTTTNSVNVYDDVAEYNYTAWNNSEDTVSKLETYITYPVTREQIQLWNNPQYKVSSFSWVNKHRLETRYKQINAGETVTQEVIMPKEVFKASNNTNNINKNAKSTIESNQAKYYDNITFNSNISYIIIIVSVMLIVAPLCISYKYFRNQQKDTDFHDYTKPNESYVKVNMLINDRIGQINKNAFYATTLSLINKKYIKISGENNELYLEINKNNNIELDSCENLVYQFFLDKVKTKTLLSDIKNITGSADVEDCYERYVDCCNSKHSINDYFNTRTSRILKYYVIMAIIYVIVIFAVLYLIYPKPPISIWAFRATFIVLPVAIMSYILSRTMVNNWNNKGKMAYNNLKYYEKYLNDFSLISHNPPMSSEKWAEDIIYAAAMGDDLSFRQHMIRYINENDCSFLMDENELVKYVYYDDDRNLYLD